MIRPDGTHPPFHVVCDTNVLFSAVYNLQSKPGSILQMAAEGRIQLAAPETVRRALTRIFHVELGVEPGQADARTERLPVEWIPEALYEGFLPAAKRLIQDPDDAPLVAAALALSLGIVSGDAAFHPLGDAAVPTWRPAKLLRLLSEAGL